MRSFLMNVTFFGFTLTMAAVALVLMPGKGGAARVRRMIGFWARSCLWLTKTILNAKIEIRGLDRFKDGARPALIVSKHQSELDVFLPIALYPDLAPIAMAELKNYPLIGPLMEKLDFIFVSVEGPRQNQLREVVEGARTTHAQGRPILIYPEGELMKVGARQRYKTGVFHIYEAIGAEATPVALSCGLVWPRREWTKIAHQTCVIEFMPPIPPGLDRDIFMAEVETRIETRTMELIEEHGAPEVVAIARERHRLGLNNEDAPNPARPAAPSRDAPDAATAHGEARPSAAADKTDQDAAASTPAAGDRRDDGDGAHA